MISRRRQQKNYRQFAPNKKITHSRQTSFASIQFAAKNSVPIRGRHRQHSSKLRCPFLAMASATLAVAGSYPSFTSCGALPSRKISDIFLTYLRRRDNCVPGFCLDQPRRTVMALKSRRSSGSPQPRSRGGRIRCILRSLL